MLTHTLVRKNTHEIYINIGQKKKKKIQNKERRFKSQKTSVRSDCTNEEGVVLEVLNAVLAQSVLSTANEPTNQILCVLRHVCDLLRELKSLLCETLRGLH